MGFLGARGVFSGKDRDPRRSTGRSRRIPLPKLNALTGEMIDVRGIEGTRRIDIVAAHILPTEIVGENENDIRFRRSIRRLQRGCQ